VSRNWKKKILAIDPLDGHEDSFLDGKNIRTVGHYRTPPSVHSQVCLYKHVPYFDDTVAWLNIWNDQHLDELRPYYELLVNDTIIVGQFETLKSLGEEANLGYIPTYHFGDRFAVRVSMP
jgi:hypothetical protein